MPTLAWACPLCESKSMPTLAWAWHTKSDAFVVATSSGSDRGAGVRRVHRAPGGAVSEGAEESLEWVRDVRRVRDGATGADEIDRADRIPARGDAGTPTVKK